MRPTVLIGLSLVLALAGAAPVALTAQPPAVGSKAPDIRLKTREGAEVVLSSYVGKKNVLLTFLAGGGYYNSRIAARLRYERDRIAGYDAEAVVVYPGSGAGDRFYGVKYGKSALTLHDLDGRAYAAYGLAMRGEDKGTWATFFIDKQGVIQLRYLRGPRRKNQRRQADLLDIYEDIERKLGLWKVPKTARKITFRQGVSPVGYAGCTALQIWPRYKKKETLAGKKTAFVRSRTGGEFVIIQFQGLVGGTGIPKDATVHRAVLRLTTINHASTQKTRLHRMTTPWNIHATFFRASIKEGGDVPWKEPGLGQAGANFDTAPATPDYQVPVTGDVQWDVTATVQGWLNGKLNHGLAILADTTKTPDHACFAMPPFMWPDRRPALIVYFEEKNGQ